MNRRLLLLGILVMFSVVMMVITSSAGPEKLTFPDFKKHVLYHNLDRPDVKTSTLTLKPSSSPETESHFRMARCLPSWSSRPSSTKKGVLLQIRRGGLSRGSLTTLM